MKKHVLLSFLCLLLLVSLAAAPVLAAALSPAVASCPSTCSCLSPAEAAKINTPGLCNGKQTNCGSEGKTEKYCYTRPVTVTPTTALPQLFATGFHPIPTTVPAFVKCSPGCDCEYETWGEEYNLTLCGGTKYLCGMDPKGIPMYCYVMPPQRQPGIVKVVTILPTGTTVPPVKLSPMVSPSGSPAAIKSIQVVPMQNIPSCSAGCACLLPSDAAKNGLSYCGGKQSACSVSPGLTSAGTGTSGQTRYCYTIPVATGSVTNLSRVVAVNRTLITPIPVPKDCPAGCSCLEEKTIRDKGYSFCSAVKTECGYTKTGGVLYCAKSGSASGPTVGQPDNVFSAIGSFFGSLFGGKPATVVQDSSVLTSYCENRYGPDFHMCGGVCVDTLTDTNHCGGCGNWCNTDPGFSPEIGTAFHCINGECVLRSQASEDPYSCGSGGFTDYDFYTPGRPGLIECPAEAPCLDGVCSALGCIDPGLTACNNICTRTSYDSNNCGSCGNACSLPNQTCRAGSCYSECEEPGTGYCRSPIDGSRYCAELDSDGVHCGRCQHSCPSSQLCSRGECVSECPSDLTNCMGGCADTMTSEWNCGECGNRCDRDPGGGWAEKCINGECRDLDLAYLPPVR